MLSVEGALHELPIAVKVKVTDPLAMSAWDGLYTAVFNEVLFEKVPVPLDDQIKFL